MSLTQNSPARTGILLMNLGTPNDPSPKSVAIYLKEFLMDRFVIDVPAFFRWILVYILIVPRRSHKSAEAYQKIWTKRGSPLKFHSEDLTDKVREKLGSKYEISLAMRYQNPSIESVLTDWKAKGISEIRVMPLYPQYALASSKSSEDRVAEVAKQLHYNAKISYLKPFYKDPGYIDAFAEKIAETLALDSWDHLLFSYHGLPERQIRKADQSGSFCLKAKECCNEINEVNSEFCYRAHCFETSRKIAEKLKLPPGKWSVSFQSRLGATKWITPYTDIVLNELADKEVKNLVITCPAFTADCLETLEEIEMRAEAQFLDRGGKQLKMVPSLNSSDLWVKAVCDMAETPGMFKNA